MSKKVGANTSSVETTPGRAKRKRAAMKREEKRWARKSGEVVTRFECPVCGGPHAKADHETQKPATGDGSRETSDAVDDRDDDEHDQHQHQDVNQHWLSFVVSRQMQHVPRLRQLPDSPQTRRDTRTRHRIARISPGLKVVTDLPHPVVDGVRELLEEIPA